MTEIAKPIRSETAEWVGNRNKAPGTLLLYPDKLVHVSSRRQMPISRFSPQGFVATAIADAVERNQAPKKVAVGRADIAEIPLDSIASVENLSAMGRATRVFHDRHLVVTTSEMIAYRFSCTPDYWIADMAKALAARGHHVLPTPQGLAVSARA